MKKKRILLTLALSVLLLLIGRIVYGNLFPVVSEFTVESGNIPEGFSGYRIAQISDLHNAELGQDNRRLLSLLQEAEPDLIVLTGDLVDSYDTDLAVAVHVAAEAATMAPTYYVCGNHEARIAEYGALTEALTEAGVTVLENEAIVLERNGDRITLIGIEDPAFLSDDSAAAVESVLRPLAEASTSYTVLLAHRPERIDTYADCGVDLVFSGHAHGGQFRLPFLGGVFAPGQGLFPKYDAGLYTVEDTAMLVSRGVGNSIFPFRVNNRPEIVVVTLTASPT